MAYNIFFYPLAKKQLDRLDGSVAIKVLKKIEFLSQNPYAGKPLGNKMGVDLTGCYKLYAAGKKLRIVYDVCESEILIRIVSVGKRDGGEICKAAFNSL